MMVRWTAGLTLLAGLALVAPVNAGLPEYLAQKDAEYSWKIDKTDNLGIGTVTTIHLVSQKWQGLTWEHKLLVFQPTGVKPNGSMLLLNTGGNPGGGMQLIALELTRRIGSPVAILFGVPNQPLFQGKKEDALIAETFCRFLDCKGEDESWPLLFPMVKSVTRAMDALQAYTKEKLGQEVKEFIISGASKRGWTSWLTGAADPRVKAIVPMVIDTLNMRPQMEHQVKCFGKPSQMVHDYVERGLIPMPNTDVARRLWSMVDPYFYRDKLTMPKMIINGANDPYWTVDALNLYWDDLKGDKYVCIVPNAGHDLQEMPESGRPDPVKGRARVLNASAAFTKCITDGKPLPKLNWEHGSAPDGKLSLRVESSLPTRTARVWVAISDSKDFRKSRWREFPAQVSSDGKMVTAGVTPPAKGYLAYYGELDFAVDQQPYSLSTQVRVVSAE